ncbi:MAG: orotidine-5'-phosphate decarboxylase [Clostridia bacterium]|nr:orotidine-5'-phosphate decarboxylase [Clostridia bacterium]
MSADILIKKIKEKKNPTVAGLDPLLSYVPEHIINECFEAHGKNLEGAAAAIFKFNTALIDALCGVVAAVKLQSAYYELYGWRGVKVLDETIKYAKDKGLYVIADVKRNDIGSTAKAYAGAYLSGADVGGENVASFDADSVTVNGYLGTDGITPFVEACREHKKSIFVLVKTSNPSSGELQDKKIGGDAVYEVMADMVNGWGEGLIGESGYSSVGAVVGATYPEMQKILRKRMPKAYFLVPGYGAQGAGAADIVNAFNKDGLGAVINSSRAIMCAYKKTGDDINFAEAAKAEAIRMRDEITAAIG